MQHAVARILETGSSGSEVVPLSQLLLPRLRALSRPGERNERLPFADTREGDEALPLGLVTAAAAAALGNFAGLHRAEAAAGAKDYIAFKGRVKKGECERMRKCMQNEGKFLPAAWNYRYVPSTCELV